MSTDAFAPASFPRLHAAAAAPEREQARLRGYADGHAEGYRAALAAAAVANAEADAARAEREAESARSVDDAVRALQAAARALAERERELTGAARAQVFARAVELAEVILGAELADGDASATAALRRATAAAGASEAHEIRLNPDDLAVLDRLGAPTAGLVLVPDVTLARGDAVVAREDGLVDARIGAALERARRAVEAGS